MIESPDIKAVGFVGSTPAAQAVYKRSTSLNKRALALGGAKNHLIVVAHDPRTVAFVLIAPKLHATANGLTAFSSKEVIKLSCPSETEALNYLNDQHGLLL